jgi:hypothetical protein
MNVPCHENRSPATKHIHECIHEFNNSDVSRVKGFCLIPHQMGSGGHAWDGAAPPRDLVRNTCGDVGLRGESDRARELQLDSCRENNVV